MKFSKIWYVNASQQQKMLQKNYFCILAFFCRFLTKKQPKLTKNEENWQNPNRLMKFSKNWYVDASQQKKMLQKSFFGISTFFGRFLNKKQPILTKNEVNCQNPNRLMKFSEIWYVDASQQRKCYKKTFFGFWPFFNQKTAKIDQKLRKLAKSKPFDEIF